MSETDDNDKTAVSIIEDVAMLARKLAAQEPFKSATGADALMAFATHLDGMVANSRADEASVVSVAVRSRRKRGAQ